MPKIRVPASSANLGPGFDALGLALGIYLDCWFERSEALAISVQGRDAHAISTASDNLIWQTALSVACAAGTELPLIDLRICNDIPLGKGLGSSAAALTAGVVIADHLLGLQWDRPRILDVAAQMEGHPDNVAACVWGSIVATAMQPGERVRVVRIELPAHYSVAVVVPDFALPTVEARSVLPEYYSRQDAIFNVQRSALLMAALATGADDAFPAALEDRFHQPYRSPLVPGLAEILKLAGKGLLGCALSGAGPSVLVFHHKGQPAVCERVREIFANHGHDSEILWPEVDRDGYQFALF